MAKQECAILAQLGGPFQPCHAVLPPKTYFESCVYDHCATGGSTEQLCNDLGAYAAACAEAGVALGDWSAGTVCGKCSVDLLCGPHSRTGAAVEEVSRCVTSLLWWASPWVKRLFVTGILWNSCPALLLPWCGGVWEGCNIPIWEQIHILYHISLH